MHLKTILILLIIGAVYLNESEAGLLKAKIAVKAVKAKALALKAPHIIAKVAVAKEVKAKTKIALLKTGAALKATKVAFVSAITAPFRTFKKAKVLKVVALKKLAALKAAKLAKTAIILKNLKKGPIILPVPVAVPQKSLPAVQPAALPAFTTLSSFNLPAPSLSDSLAPIQGFISGAQKAIQTAGSGIPFISQLTKSFGSAEVKKDAPVVAPAPVYRYVPELDFPNSNQVSYQPKTEAAVQTYEVPATAYGLPAKTYGIPN
ncbi:uncharacterized protein LOC116347046 [Contarinia nasturtii]|uniref:uncharacterized protein LOC116347046 n=1 Tax=Contarinia nasturtii TaxID=265458 RepID=UPI0012D486ED|nr:uncharacterized protein LOC116347046 [Contarinia nasturtii]